LASAGADGTVRVWDARRCLEVARLVGHEAGLTNDASVLSVEWSPDGGQLASGGVDGIVRVWDARHWREVTHLMGHECGLSGDRRVWSLSWSPGGRQLVTGGEDGTVRVWDSRMGQEVTELPGQEGGAFSDPRVWFVSWSPDGRKLATGGMDGTVRIWDAKCGQELIRSVRHDIGPSGYSSVLSASWSPDGRLFASSGLDGTIRVWDAEGTREVSRLIGHAAGSTGDPIVWSVSWSPNSRQLVSSGVDGTLRVWNVRDGQAVARLTGHEAGASGDPCVFGASWSPDGRLLASGGADGTVRLWDAQGGQEVAKLVGHSTGPSGDHRVWRVCWCPDGRRVASVGEDGTVRIWDAKSARELTRLVGHEAGPYGEDAVWSVSWSPDGLHLASGGEDGTVRVWDARQGQEVARLVGQEAGPSGSRRVLSVSWSPDGRQLASSGEDGTVRVWAPRDPDIPARCTWKIAGDVWWAETPGGFLLLGDQSADAVRLSVSRPERPGTVLYVPLGALAEVLHQPDRVAAALAGDLSNDDPSAALAHAGWTGKGSWDGRLWYAPTSCRTESAGETGEQGLEPNRFLPGRAVSGIDHLAGRDKLLDDLLALIANRSPAVLRGPRRSGKTSILNALAQRIRSGHMANGASWRPARVIQKSLEGAAVCSADDLARWLADDLRAEARPAHALGQRLADEGGAVLLLDEVANLQSADSELFAWLRQLGQTCAAVVVAGTHDDWARVIRRAAAFPGSSFGNDVTPVDLGPLDRDAALAFLADTSPRDARIEPEQTGRWIVERCGTWPFYLQVLGFSVVQAARAGNRLSLADKRGVDELYRNDLLVQRNHVFEQRWSDYQERAHAVMSRIRQGRLPPLRELAPPDRQAVLDAGLCNALGDWLEDKPWWDWVEMCRT